MKACKDCGQVLDSSMFCKHPQTKDKLGCICKPCLNIRSRKYYKNNAEQEREKSLARYHRNEGKERQALRRKANKLRDAARSKIWRERNKEKLREQQRMRELKFKLIHGVVRSTVRRSISPTDRLYHILRQRLHGALRRRAKKGSAVRDLGMPIDAFLVYLNLDALDKYGIPYTGNEKLFHIDHIHPLARFNLEDPEQLKIAVRWDNLQVLTVEENLRKSSKYEETKGVEQ